MLLLLLALIVALLPVDAAAAGRATQQPDTSRTVLATVVDARNQPLVDVDVDSFVVRESGQSREILSAHIADYPIVVLLDNGGDADRDFENIRKAAGRFIARVGQRPIAVGTLADPPMMIAAFDEDRAQLLTRVEAVVAIPSAETALLQGLANGTRTLREAGSPFRAIVVISASPAGNKGHEPGDLIASILESGAVIYAVANRYRSAAQGAVSATEADVLRELAEQTHGQFTAIYSSASYEVALDHLADRLAMEMMIEYLVPPGSPAGNDVKLGVRIPGASVRGLGVTPR